MSQLDKTTFADGIRQGNSVEFSVGPKPSVDLTVGTWTCWVGAYDSTDAEMTKKQITGLNSENTKFLAFFTPDETATWTVDSGTKTTIVAQLDRTDTTPPISVEYHYETEVCAGLLTPV